MHNKLQAIIAQKQLEVAKLKKFILNEPTSELARCLQGEVSERKIKSLEKSLNADNLAVIAEIKRHSPANGMLSEILDPVLLAKQYQQAGSAAISVLTDEMFFKGSLNDLQQVSLSLANTSCPILRKDFIIDEIQIAEAAVYGADAILLIVAVLQDKTQELLDYATYLGLDVLLEVHTSEELALALDTDAQIIGINNRNLNTFVVDVQTSYDLIDDIPKNIIAVSESGISDKNTAQSLYAAGFNAVLVGEALVKANNPEYLIHAMQELPLEH
jgi:indole-3-glycerol phosphate synthase